MRLYANVGFQRLCKENNLSVDIRRVLPESPHAVDARFVEAHDDMVETMRVGNFVFNRNTYYADKIDKQGNPLYCATDIFFDTYRYTNDELVELFKPLHALYEEFKRVTPDYRID